MQKAKLRVDPIEQEYVKKYGHLPDYDFIEIRQKHGQETATNTVQERINGIWQDMKNQNSPEFIETTDTPFEKKVR